jgi:hypothetical protein
MVIFEISMKCGWETPILSPIERKKIDGVKKNNLGINSGEFSCIIWGTT